MVSWCLFTPDGTEFYRGRPDGDAVAAALTEAEEHPQIIHEVIQWLRRADVLGSGFLFKPVNSMQLAPLAKPAGGMRL